MIVDLCACARGPTPEYAGRAFSLRAGGFGFSDLASDVFSTINRRKL